MSGLRVLFIDRDGTLIEEPEDFQVDALDKVVFARDVIPSLLSLRDAGFEFVLVSNQDGLGTASFPEEDFTGPHRLMLDVFESQGISFREQFICPHLPDDGCGCRKPRAGLLTRFLVENPIDAERSFVIGDRETDLELADNLGLKGFRVDLSDPASGWSALTAQLLQGARTGSVSRKTRETDIAVTVDLNRTGCTIETGIGFFDHMLEQLGRHGGFYLDLSCSGDLHVDEHHVVEDCALAIGSALRDALGNKAGISRYGFTLPMDEAQARVALDLSGRPVFVFNGEFSREQVGGLPTELVPHFFRSLADTLGAALHIDIDGENDHHKVEGMFKAVGRSLRQAVATGADSGVPSTKGVL
ncbi:MAG: bifunctional histidinol-phosphatase/imidazoleglycerol-phosphate dehydratase HisB [Pseudomonadota bacterium]